jgi:Niemann-Pick C1 protein
MSSLARLARDGDDGSAPGSGPGICAMRGNCGRASMFGAELPCPDSDPATEVRQLCYMRMIMPGVFG